MAASSEQVNYGELPNTALRIKVILNHSFNGYSAGDCIALTAEEARKQISEEIAVEADPRTKLTERQNRSWSGPRLGDDRVAEIQAENERLAGVEAENERLRAELAEKAAASKPASNKSGGAK